MRLSGKADKHEETVDRVSRVTIVFATVFETLPNSCEVNDDEILLFALQAHRFSHIEDFTFKIIQYLLLLFAINNE